METQSPNGRTVLTLKKGTGIAAGILTLFTTTTIPALKMAGYAVPEWVLIVAGFLLAAVIIIAQVGGGVRTQKPKVVKAAKPEIPAPPPGDA